METFLRFIKKILPSRLFNFFQPVYHYILSFLSTLLYRFPSKKLFIIAITGTKGKSSTAELVNVMLESAGYKTSLASTIRFKIGDKSKSNLYKMTLPGRFFIQKFLRNGVQNGCTHAIIEITSEAVKQHRHKFIDLDTLIFTNISPEHIESHGSFENYLNAKLEIANSLSKSTKKDRSIISNIDDEHGKDFLDINVENKIEYSLSNLNERVVYPKISFVYKNVGFTSSLQGEFNLYNILAAIKLGEALQIPLKTISSGLSKLKSIPGRVEYVDLGQDFKVVVDYAHSIDSLTKLYETFKDEKCVCVLGNTGGGRDAWKRPKMGKIAEKYCDTVILTDEDPYDEDPLKIVEEMKAGMNKKPLIIMDRRSAISKAFSIAEKNTIVLITGKGTDPYIMRANGGREPWSDKRVVEEELKKVIRK